MSLQFSDTTNYKGLVQIYEKEAGFNRGDISGDTDRLKELTADINLVWDYYIYLALKSSGKWQYDDSNHTKYPIIYTDLVSTQQDYAFTTDEQGNLILDIYKVMVLPNATATLYEEIFPVDQQRIQAGKEDNIASESTAGGTPFRYDKTANGIFLDPIPDYSTDGDTTGNYGLKIFINREANYFTSTDITKKPGCPGIHHRYFALKPAFDYARRNNLSNYNTLREEVVSFEGDEEKGVTGSIERYFARRSRDERQIMTPRITKFI